MIALKSRRDIARMHDAGRLVAAAHRLARSMLQPGMTTAEIDGDVERFLVGQGATPLFKGYPGAVPYPAATCISIDEQVAHGVPGRRKLRRGELVSIDIACRLGGWCCDAAWTWPVGETDELRRRLLDAGRRPLERAVEELAVRARWSEVASRMEAEVRQAGFAVVEEFVGHGIGRELHEDPQAPGRVSPALRENDFRLQPGLVLAIEPVIAAGRRDVRLLADRWTVATCDGQPAVHFEHTVALTADGPLVLTDGIDRS